LIGLVIAPILGDGHSTDKKAAVGACCAEMESSHHGDMKACAPHAKGEYMIGKCDMRECAKMSKEECAAMCDSLKCSPEEKEMCMAHYGKDGKFMDGGYGQKACCKEMKNCENNAKCKDKATCKKDCKK
jgi:K(+)-stimulated pyrophosphate-energized sodium pump